MQNGRRITNTRFADDILLYAKSFEELQFMMAVLIFELSRIGLTINEKKTKILASEHDQNIDSRFVEIADHFIEILPSSSHHRYLGRLINEGRFKET